MTGSDAGRSGRPPAASRSGWLLVLAALALGGCRPAEIRSEKPMEVTVERLLAVREAYAQFTSEKGRPPRGPDDLKGLVRPDELISPRDGEPFTVFWGVDMRVPKSWGTGRPILGHERTGANGSRYALTMLGNVELLTDDELRSSSFPPGNKAP